MLYFILNRQFNEELNETSTRNTHTFVRYSVCNCLNGEQLQNSAEACLVTSSCIAVNFSPGGIRCAACFVRIRAL